MANDGWQCGVVGCVNKVTPSQAWLVLGRGTIFGRMPPCYLDQVASVETTKETYAVNLTTKKNIYSSRFWIFYFCSLLTLNSECQHLTYFLLNLPLMNYNNKHEK